MVNYRNFSLVWMLIIMVTSLKRISRALYQNPIVDVMSVCHIDIITWMNHIIPERSMAHKPDFFSHLPFYVHSNMSVCL